MSHEATKDTKIRRWEDQQHSALERCARTVIGGAIEVHRHLGPGLLEAAYEQALLIELRSRGIYVEQQLAIPIMYKGHLVCESRLDLLVEGQLVVELKAVERIAPVHMAQVISYLRAGAFQLALLINFNVAMLRDGIRRIVGPG